MEYAYHGTSPDHTVPYLFPVVRRVLSERLRDGGRIFELGCGNGSNARAMSELGYDVTAVDPSESGIQFARSVKSTCRFEIGSAYDNLSTTYGAYRALVSLEVIEHLYSPHSYVGTIYNLLEPGGVAIISTPYHGYVKNIAIAATGKWDTHHSPLWEGGHIKFWSRKTLGALFEGAGMREIGFARVGRLPPVAKSMVCVFQRD